MAKVAELEGVGNVQIVLPENFKYPRFWGGAWLNSCLRWTDEDIKLLISACDLRIDYTSAANTIGRSPTILYFKARELCIRIPRDWNRIVRVLKGKHQQLQYPYIIQPDKRHEDLIAVNRMVSRALPGREDVCQDIMLALWESRISLQELRADPEALRRFIRSFRKASFERSGYGVESMDVTIHSHDGNGRSKYESKHYQSYDSESEWKRYTENFEGQLVEELTQEEKALGVPAAFWMRHEQNYYLEPK